MNARNSEDTTKVKVILADALPTIQGFDNSLKQRLESRGYEVSLVYLRDERYLKGKTTVYENILSVHEQSKNLATQVFVRVSTSILTESICRNVILGDSKLYDAIVTTFARPCVQVFLSSTFNAKNFASYHRDGWVKSEVRSGNLDETYSFPEEALPRFEMLRQHLIKIFNDECVGVNYFKSSWEPMAWLVDNLTDVSTESTYLRLYVPDGKYQSEQIESFVHLFESYLNRVERLPITVDTTRSAKGTQFTFKISELSDGSFLPNLQSAIAKFDEFMALCQDDPVEASTLLSNRNLSQAQCSALVLKYSKQYGRLMIDAKQEFETKKQLLHHAFEAEAFELRYSNGVTIQPTPIEPSHIGNLLMPLTNSSPVTIINLMGNQQAETVVNAIVNQVYGSGIVYSHLDNELIQVIKEHANSDREALSLKSDLDQLKDETMEPEKRKSAKQNIKEFLSRNASTIGDIAFRALLEHLTKGITG